MNAFRKSWWAMQCVWGDKKFNAQYVGKLGIWKAPGGRFPCKEENGYVKCFIVDAKDYYGGKPVKLKVYVLFPAKKGKVGLKKLVEVDGVPAGLLGGFCAQFDSKYDPSLGGCVKDVGYCSVEEVQF
jgi:hypothetical protein